MKQLMLATLLVTTSAMGFSVNEGEYTSDEGCNVKVFTNYDGNIVVDFESPEDNEVYTYSYVAFNPNYSEAIRGPGLCGDDDGLPVAKVKKSYTELSAKCGGKLSVIDVKLNITTDEDGELDTFSYKSKVARFSTMGGWGLPQPKKTKGNMTCTNFVRK